jgi:DUF3039 family protein
MSISLTDGVIDGVTVQRTITEELVPYEDTDDGADHRAHIVNPPMNLHIWKPGMEGQDIVDLARLTGEEITALCGFKFVPKRNPDKYKACDPCLKIAGHILSME